MSATVLPVAKPSCRPLREVVLYFRIIEIMATIPGDRLVAAPGLGLPAAVDARAA
jgi:hypothetical protein